jgi:hypothetical protein
MATWSAESTATPAAAWALLARPGAWSTWAPHVRGAWGLGSPEVEVGAVGAARLLGVVPVPAKVTDKTPGRSWTWRVGGLVEMVHRVEPRPGGCAVALDLRAPGPLEAALAASYGPVVRLLLGRLARAAERP